MPEQEVLMAVERLDKWFPVRKMGRARGYVKAVNDVSLQIRRGETLGIVGESGCGKSVSALAVMRLLAKPAGRIVHGRIRFEGRNLLELDDEAMRQIRGRDISMIFQEPMTSLNPVMTIGRQIAEVLLLHQGMTTKQAHERAIEMLRLVKIPEPEQRVKEYPHQLSGGMRQRAMIAMALSCQPSILIADEPTTAVDVTVQAQVLLLIKELQAELGMSVIFITHDLGVIAEMANDVAVMYLGRIVEIGDRRRIFSAPAQQELAVSIGDGYRQPNYPVKVINQFFQGLKLYQVAEFEVHGTSSRIAAIRLIWPGSPGCTGSWYSYRGVLPYT